MNDDSGKAFAGTGEIVGGLDALGYGAAVFGSDGGLAAWNDSFCRYLEVEGLSAGMAFATVAALMPGDTALELEGDPVVVENPGGLVEFRATRLAGGGILLVAAAQSDLRGVIGELAASERRFHKIFDANPGLSAITDPADGRHIAVNEQWLATLGWSRDEAIGRTALELGVWADIDDRRRLLEILRRDGRVREFEARLKAKDGTERAMSIAGEIIDLDGERRLLLTGHDITERLRSERRLAETGIAMERAYRDLERLTFAAAHHLREPVRAIVTHAQRFERHCAEQVDGDARETLGFVVEGARRIDALVRDLGLYASVPTRLGSPEPVDLGQIFDGAIQDLIDEILETDAHLARGPLPVVAGQPDLLAAVVRALLANALTYGPDGGTPEIEIDAVDAGDHWALSVSDNGIGFDPEYAERLFDVFFRLHTQEAYPGTGMGLAVCRRIAEAHGGTIQATSTPGRGATFTLTLPK